MICLKCSSCLVGEIMLKFEIPFEIPVLSMND